MSAITGTQPASKKHLATLSQILLLLNLPAGILGLVLTVYGKQLGDCAVTIGLYVLFNMFMKTIWKLLFLFYAAAIIVFAGIAGKIVSMATGDVHVEFIMSLGKTPLNE